MRVLRWAQLAAVLVLVAFSVALSNAAVITPVAVTATSNYSDGNGSRVAINTINGAGLDPSPGDVLTKLHNQSPNANWEGGMWLSQEEPQNLDPPTPQSITFDLGAVYLLTDMYVWNYAERTSGATNAGLGIKDANIYADLNPDPSTLVQSFQFAQAAEVAPPTTFAGPANWGTSYNVPGQLYSFTAPVLAQYVEIDALNSWFPNPIIKSRGLSEVRFIGQLIPEPSTFVLLSLAVAAFGLCSLRS
jgi:hypothetical protein